MVENSILIPVDFTPASEKAIEFGILLARKGHFNLSLLHVFEDDGYSFEDCETKLKSLAEKIDSDEDFFCDYRCERGNIFNIITAIASQAIYRMMVIGTHGPKGIRQKFFGPDILKLLKKASIPSVIVQEGSNVPEGGFTKAIFPVGGHDDYQKNNNRQTTGD